MKITRTPLKGCIVIKPDVYLDNRGYFMEAYKKKTLDAALGYEVNFTQDNQTSSSRGVLRGLHFQKGAYAQAKLVRVIQGAVLDVAVDLRLEYPTAAKRPMYSVLDTKKSENNFGCIIKKWRQGLEGLQNDIKLIMQ